jgi:hypothetical protein
MARLIQQDLFARELNFVPLSEYLDSVKPVQHEKKFMRSIMDTAKKMNLPCIHVDYFCGNKFYATCDPCSQLAHKRNPGAPRVQAVCSRCHKPVVVTCLNRLNKRLAGHYDILGIDWAIETKHKTTKKKNSPAKLSPRQQVKDIVYDLLDVPHIAVHEGNQDLLWNFLQEQHFRKYNKRI